MTSDPGAMEMEKGSEKALGHTRYPSHQEGLAEKSAFGMQVTQIDTERSSESFLQNSGQN